MKHAVCLPLVFGLGLLSTVSPVRAEGPSRPTDPLRDRERTCFQTHSAWSPRLQLGSDVAICYGIDETLPERIAGWKAQGYVTHLMTGVSWGEYQDYLYGRFDGKNHEDEAQTERNGKVISHGGDVYYMSPGESFGKFLSRGVKAAMDAGAEAVHLEEPEFWVRAGYSAGFKREWKAYYGEDWVPPHSSPDAQYRASLLKYYLYQRALKQVFDFVKAENARTGRHVRCYVPTHSLINYAHWCIVSPESSLMGVGADGFIAQVWTGTARTPNFYEGRKKERTFETAFLEYGSMMDVVRASGGTVWFLNDPIEDNPNHSWADYRENWESTLTASLLWPQVSKYEVMPWPERIYRGRYPAAEPGDGHRQGERVPLPHDYGTELQTVITALNDMEQSDISWDCGTRGIGVVVSDSMMFQRGQPSPSDPDLGSFYGLAMPLVKRGIPVQPSQLENAPLSGALDHFKVLVMTYEGMKPMTPEVHDALASWVRNGGALVFLGDDSDPYNHVRSWWNDPKKGMTYDAPRQHLFERLGLPKDAPKGEHKVGRGVLVYDQASPASLSRQAEGGAHLRSKVRQACEAVGLAYRETNHLILRRGPYIIASGLDESADDALTVLKGRFLDLFDARLPVLDSVTVEPGSRNLLLDLDRVSADAPSVLASACKVMDTRSAPDGQFSFFAEGPEGVEAAARIALKQKPSEVTLDTEPLAGDKWSWDTGSSTLLVRFPNAAKGHWVSVR